LLLTPGILTDLFGLALLIPWTRSRLTGMVQARIQQGIRRGTTKMTFVSFGGGMHAGMGPPPPGTRSTPDGTKVDPAVTGRKPDGKHDENSGRDSGEVGNVRVVDDT